MQKIQAGFRNMLEAGKTVEALKGMGYKNAHLDAGEKFYEEYSEDINFAGTNIAPSLSALVLRSNHHLYHTGKAPLIAANPMVSGIGSYREMIDNVRTLLIVRVDDDRADEVKKLIRDAGGTV